MWKRHQLQILIPDETISPNQMPQHTKLTFIIKKKINAYICSDLLKHAIFIIITGSQEDILQLEG